MTDDDQAAQPLQRRILLRGGAVLAGAAGATVLGAALAPSTASAADGDPVLAGKDNTETTSTSLTITSGSTPALTLSNPNGPGLRLSLIDNDWEGNLAAGELAGNEFGPLAGVDFGNGPETTYLATGKDLDMIPVAVAVPPGRLLDTRSAAGRTGIVRSSSSALSANGMLKANSWIDVAVLGSDDGFEVSAAFLNAAVIDPTKNGYLTVYPPGDRPNVSTINFRTGVNLSNAAFVGVGEVYQGRYLVRIHSSQTTHILLDLSGAVLALASSGAEPSSKAMRRRTVRQAKRAALLKQSLQRSRR